LLAGTSTVDLGADMRADACRFRMLAGNAMPRAWPVIERFTEEWIAPDAVSYHRPEMTLRRDRDRE